MTGWKKIKKEVQILFDKKPKKDKNNKTDKNKGNKDKKKKKLKLEFSAKGKKSKKWLKVTKNGKVTLKKGIKKGVYKVRVKTNRGTKNYKKDVVYDGEMKNVYRVLAVE
mgnify:CR=1 FL=1